MLVQQKTQDTRAISKGSIRAVVGGGSVSGLLAARVLAPYCLSIHIVDKDDLLAPPSLSFQEISDHSVRIHCTSPSSILPLLTCMMCPVEHEMETGRASALSAPSIDSWWGQSVE